METQNIETTSILTPIGLLWISCMNNAITHIYKSIQETSISDKTNNPLLIEATKQLQAYFDGKLKQFDLPLYYDYVSEYTDKVLNIIRNTKYGETYSYQTIADISNYSKRFRTVARICSHNPIPIIIPCHRIIRNNNEIGRYMFGTEAKKILIDLEQKNSK